MDQAVSPRKITSPRVLANSSPRNMKTVVLGEQNTFKQEIRKAKETTASLVVVRGPSIGKRYLLEAEESVIGRDPTVQISLADQSVSRKHARINKEGEAYRLTDLGSANGTHVNDAKISSSSVVLAKDDLIKLGGTLLKFAPPGELDGHFLGSLGHAARTDPLTKVHNKAHFLELLEAEFDSSGDVFSVFYFDVDRFKAINDTHGHEAGDMVLKELVGVAQEVLDRSSSVLARMGGDEFAVLLYKSDKTSSMSVGEKLREAVEKHSFRYDGKEVKVTVSIGVSESDDKCESATALLKQADLQLYAAKQAGRNNVK